MPGLVLLLIKFIYKYKYVSWLFPTRICRDITEDSPDKVNEIEKKAGSQGQRRQEAVFWGLVFIGLKP